MANIIEVEDLKKSFAGMQAVRGISLSVQQGSTFGFLGLNGAGKSSTIKMLTTLLRPTSGSILIDGNDPTKDPHAVRRAIGVVFQDPSLDDDLTAWENMELHGVYTASLAACAVRALASYSNSSNSTIAVTVMYGNFPAA